MLLDIYLFSAGRLFAAALVFLDQLRQKEIEDHWTHDALELKALEFRRKKELTRLEAQMKDSLSVQRLALL